MCCKTNHHSVIQSLDEFYRNEIDKLSEEHEKKYNRVLEIENALRKERDAQTIEIIDLKGKN